MSFGSATLLDGKVYFTEQSGQSYIFAANPEKFELLAKNQIGSGDSGFNATPAISDGALFIRSNQYLYCVSEK